MGVKHVLKRWLCNLLQIVPPEEMHGIHLDTSKFHWELEGPDTFSDLFEGLKCWVPEDAILYFEGGAVEQEVNQYVSARSIPAQSRVALGTIWPRPDFAHVPATPTNLSELAEIMQTHAEMELAMHFHVYREGEVLLEWHDAFSQPMLLSGKVAEEDVRSFAEALQTVARKIEPADPSV